MQTLILALTLLSSPAHAQQEVCGAVYTSKQMDLHLAAAEEAFAAFDLNGARAILKGTHKSTLCLGEVASPARMAKLARLLGLVFFLEQDDDAVYRWSLSQQYSWPDLPWPADLTEHPYREASEEAELPPARGPENMGLVVPKKGAFFANGIFLDTPLAPAEVPLFVQITDKKGTIVKQYWQHGAGFPEKLLVEGGEALVPPRWYALEDSTAIGYTDAPLFGGPDVADAGDDAVADAESATDQTEAPVADPAQDSDDPPESNEPADDNQDDAASEATDGPSASEDDVEPSGPETDAATLPKRKRKVAIPTFTAVAEVDDYVDPFEDARLRAIARETTVRKDVDASTGLERTVTTDVITFAVDEGEGHATTYAELADWLPYHPEWSAERARSEGSAPKTYLKDWKGGEAPAARGAAPVVWVPLAVAQAYCDDWAKGLEDASVEAEQAVREWRLQDGTGVVREIDGTITAEDASATAGDLGFRCK